MKHDYLIVGAGFAGCVLAERLANGLHQRVLLVERRNHLGGNAHDFRDNQGLLIQQYGPHIFHTNSRAVWDYLSQFTTWNGYVHRVLANLGTEGLGQTERSSGLPLSPLRKQGSRKAAAQVDSCFRRNDMGRQPPPHCHSVGPSKEVYLPINLDTMERLCGRTFTPEELRDYFDQRRVKLARIENARDVVISQVGTELYELLFKNYTKKQWGLYPEQLDPQVTGRLPVRLDRDTRYFADTWQGLPAEGFTRMFERMLESPSIEVRLKAEYRDVAGSADYRGLIFTGAIDEFFDYRYGPLPYRGALFRFETLPVERFQNAGVVNYPNHQEYTRITEFKQLYLQQHPQTTICYEYGSNEGPACYPVPTPANYALYAKYKAEADVLDDTHFVGRLAQYQYLNMDQVVERALNLFQEIQGRA